MSGPHRNPTLAFAAEIASDALLAARADRDHELGDLIEADMATAVRCIWQAAGPMLRACIHSMQQQETTP